MFEKEMEAFWQLQTEGSVGARIQPTSRVPPPINTLIEDIFLTIFDWIANMNTNDNAFIDIVHASWVCLEWRNRLLNSPATWAKIMDINYLALPDEKFKNWLNRTNGLPLCVKGTVKSAQEFTWFTQNVLKRSERIRSFDLVLKIVDSPQDLGRFLQNPWAVLEVFKLDMTRSEYFTSMPATDKSWDLFTVSRSDISFLKEFHFPGIRFHLDPQSLENIGKITIGFPFEFKETLSILRQICRLASLTMKAPKPSSSGSDLTSPPISLPHLNELCIVTEIERWSNMLNSLKVPPTCALDLQEYAGGPSNLDDEAISDPNSDPMKELHAWLVKYVRGHPDFQRIKALEVRANKTKFIIRAFQYSRQAIAFQIFKDNVGRILQVFEECKLHKQLESVSFDAQGFVYNEAEDDDWDLVHFISSSPMKILYLRSGLALLLCSVYAGKPQEPGLFLSLEWVKIFTQQCQDYHPGGKEFIEREVKRLILLCRNVIAVFR